MTDKKEKMMKRIRRYIIAAALLCVLLLAGCGGGNVANAVIDYGESAIYSQEDVKAAVQVVKTSFAESFDGCELYSIAYTSDDCNSPENVAWMNELAEGQGMDAVFTQCIILKSDFHSPKDPEKALSLNVDQDYTGFEWCQTRTDGGKWTLMTCGY